MALTLVSRISSPTSCSRVSQRVHLLEPARLYPSVCLGRADGCVAKQLLNCPQISTSFEQMGGERMPQRMRSDTALHGRTPHRAAQAATDVRRGEALAGLRDEQRRLGLLQERGAATLQVARNRAPGRLPGGHDAGLRPLAEDTDVLGV